jgi:hypothetical protein
MTIDPGTRLSHYEVLSRIGAGGTGDVYRAKDTRLDRHTDRCQACDSAILRNK